MAAASPSSGVNTKIGGRRLKASAPGPTSSPSGARPSGPAPTPRPAPVAPRTDRAPSASCCRARAQWPDRHTTVSLRGAGDYLLPRRRGAASARRRRRAPAPRRRPPGAPRPAGWSRTRRAGPRRRRSTWRRPTIRCSPVLGRSRARHGGRGPRRASLAETSRDRAGSALMARPPRRAPAREAREVPAFALHGELVQRDSRSAVARATSSWPGPSVVAIVPPSTTLPSRLNTPRSSRGAGRC